MPIILYNNQLLQLPCNNAWNEPNANWCCKG